MAFVGASKSSEHADLQDQLNLLISQGIPAVSLWLGVLYIIFSVSHLIVLPQDIAFIMSPIAGATALILFALSVVSRRRPIPPFLAHPVAAGILILVLFNSLIHMVLTQDIQQTTNVMLTFVGAAVFILSTPWLIMVLMGGLAGWGLALLQIPDPRNKVHYGFGIVTSLALSGIIHYFHSQTTKRLEKARADENRNKLELTILNSIISSITSSLDPANVFQEVVDAVEKFVPHVNGATLQVLEGGNRLETRAWGRNIQPEILTFYQGEGIAGQAVSKRKLINVRDVNSDSQFVVGLEKVDFQSLLAVPLLVGDKIVGVISVEASTIAAFGQEEERKIQLLAKYAAIAIENSRLYSEYALAEETLKNYTDHLQGVVESRTSELRIAQEKIFEQKILEQEIELARQVQTSLLAQQIPLLDGYMFAATAIPARYVGGDFYDFVEKDGVCNIILADVSGKGISAAMLTSTARTLVRAALKYENKPALILSNMQDAIYQDMSNAEMFATFFVGSLDPIRAAFTYANAGHTETVWWRHKTRSVERLIATGLPIGIVSNNEISERQILLCPGDILVFYSDGITETLDPQQGLFGIERLVDIVSMNLNDSAHTLAQRILTEVHAFSDGAPLVDDLTLVVLKVLPRTVSFQYQINMELLDEPVRFIRRHVEPYGIDFAYQVELAVSEVVTNIAKHAYGNMTGELNGQIVLQEDGVILDFYDNGKSFDPSQLPEIDFEKAHTGGYGMHIVRQTMDEVEYSSGSEAHGNHWHLVKNLWRNVS